MNISELEEKGAFIDTSLIKVTGKEWKVTDLEKGKPEEDYKVTYKIDFFIRKVPWSEYAQVIEGIPEEKRTKVNNDALTVAACVRFGEKGEDALTYEQVVNMDSSLFYLLYNSVLEIYSPKN